MGKAKMHGSNMRVCQPRKKAPNLPQERRRRRRRWFAGRSRRRAIKEKIPVLVQPVSIRPADRRLFFLFSAARPSFQWLFVSSLEAGCPLLLHLSSQVRMDALTRLAFIRPMHVLANQCNAMADRAASPFVRLELAAAPGRSVLLTFSLLWRAQQVAHLPAGRPADWPSAGSESKLGKGETACRYFSSYLPT